MLCAPKTNLAASLVYRTIPKLADKLDINVSTQGFVYCCIDL